MTTVVKYTPTGTTFSFNGELYHIPAHKIAEFNTDVLLYDTVKIVALWADYKITI